MIRPLAFIALASPVMAQETAPLCGGLGSASITADGPGYVVTVQNPLRPTTGWNDALSVVVLEIDGLSVAVQLHSQQGREPDDFVVLPPVGFIADPARLTVEAHDTGVIRPVPMGLS